LKKIGFDPLADFRKKVIRASGRLFENKKTIRPSGRILKKILFWPLAEFRKNVIRPSGRILENIGPLNGFWKNVIRPSGRLLENRFGHWAENWKMLFGPLADLLETCDDGLWPIFSKAIPKS
jgi:hypothetical protein